MTDILELIQQRHSTRIPFDPERPVSKDDLKRVVEAGKWAHTARLSR